MSRGGRRRALGKALRVAGAAAALALAAWGTWQVVETLKQGPPQDVAPRLGPPEFVTDGVLDKAWLARTLALPKDASLVNLDLGRLRTRLLADPQVAAASLTRQFPATLVVHLTERQPVARVSVQVGYAEPKPYLVARDGAVYVGSGYAASVVGSLPWLDGVKLARSGSGFAPIAGMQTVAGLLSQAQLNADWLYRTWRVVSLARLASDSEIEVRTVDGLKVTFGAQEDTPDYFLRQLARLDKILDTVKGAPAAPPITAINLAFGAQVPVDFAPAAQQVAGQPLPPSSLTPFHAQ